MVTALDRARGRQQAQRLLRAASGITQKTIVGKVVQAGARTLLLIGVVDEDDDMKEALRLHRALIGVSVRERLDVDVIVVSGKD
jgi:hypothetical protein